MNENDVSCGESGSSMNKNDVSVRRSDVNANANGGPADTNANGVSAATKGFARKFAAFSLR
jgi:hypothetical protein